MKLSVSVPDDLWAEARTLGDDLNPSHLVQAALRLWVERKEPEPAFGVEPPTDVETEFNATRDRFVQEAREEFERGYRQGVQTAAKLKWSVIERLAESYRFDIKRWAEACAEGARLAEFGNIPSDWAPSKDVMDALIEGLGGLAHPVGDEMWVPGPTFIRGFAQAFRDLWAEVAEGAGERGGEKEAEEL